MQQRLFNALKVNLVQQQFNRLDTLAIDRQVEGTATHVVGAVYVQRYLVRVLERLTDDRDVPQGGGVQKYSLLVRQL